MENVESVRSSATTTYLMNSNIGTTFCKGQNANGNLLSISADNIYYRVTVDADGNVTSILVTNGEFTYNDSKIIIKKKDIVDDGVKLTEINTSINC